jgi:hypothetical protein
VRRRVDASEVKYFGSTEKMPLIRSILSTREDDRIPGVAVKCVDIRRNTSGEGGHLARN